MPVIDQVVGEGETAGAEADDQHFPAGRRARQRPPKIERVPTRQQAVDFEAPG